MAKNFKLYFIGCILYATMCMCASSKELRNKETLLEKVVSLIEKNAIKNNSEIENLKDKIKVPETFLKVLSGREFSIIDPHGWSVLMKDVEDYDILIYQSPPYGEWDYLNVPSLIYMHNNKLIHLKGENALSNKNYINSTTERLNDYLNMITGNIEKDVKICKFPGDVKALYESILKTKNYLQKINTFPVHRKEVEIDKELVKELLLTWEYIEKYSVKYFYEINKKTISDFYIFPFEFFYENKKYQDDSINCLIPIIFYCCDFNWSPDGVPSFLEYGYRGKLIARTLGAGFYAANTPAYLGGELNYLLFDYCSLSSQEKNNKERKKLREAILEKCRALRKIIIEPY